MGLIEIIFIGFGIGMCLGFILFGTYKLLLFLSR